MRNNYNYLLNEIRKDILIKGKQQEYEKSIQSIDFFSRCAYNLNICLTDPIIEDYLSKLSKKIIKRRKKLNTKKHKQHKIIFYDSFGWDNRGLTQQYLRGLIKNNYQLLFIFENFNEKLCKNIFQELKDYKNCRVHKMNESIPMLSRIEKTVNLIEEFEPTHSFLHLAPWSSSAIVIWNCFEDVKRFQINLTDHAFWLGKNTFDFCIEFRDYGYQVSKEYRKISEQKIIKLPFYPIIDSSTEFKGFPKEAKGKTIVVTGASYYKVLGESDKYFKLLKIICNNNSDIIILFAGSGDRKLFKKLLSKYNLEKFVYPIGDRTDISEVVKRADIYLSSYPITGGLMGQFAVRSGVPAIGYSEKYSQMNQIESFIFKTDIQLTYFNDSSFISEINKMIVDKKYRIDKALKLKDKVISESDFSSRLKDILEGVYDQNFKELKIDQNAFQKLYLEVENKYTNSTLKYLFKNRHDLQYIKSKIEKMYYSRYPIDFIKNLFIYIKNKF